MFKLKGVVTIFYFMLAIGLHLPLLGSEEAAYTLIEDQAKLPILTPSFSHRQTLKLKLANGLKVYLISDPAATQSAAALIVHAGSWQDPISHPGLAHFLEHMLFLGTEKYPIESDYDRFIKEHDGEANAYTASDHTVYLFSIHNHAFAEALDRFSYFFKKPLFNPSGVARELQAIDQEFAKDFDDDMTREYHVLKELSHPNHPFHTFSCGNSATLSTASQDTLIEWHEEHYSANLMHLVIYSPLSMDDLKSLTIQNFADIPNKQRFFPYSEESLFSPAHKGSIVYIEPFKNIRTLRLIWEMPIAFAHMHETRPDNLVSYVLGHEGPGSLLDGLKSSHLAESLSCGGYHLGPNHLLFSLNLNLTEQGLQNIDEIVNRCFEAIATLKQHGTFSHVFEEIKKMSTIRYQYQSHQDPFSYVMQLGGWLSREHLETFPEQTLIIQQFDPQNVDNFLKHLTPQNMMISLIANPSLTGVKFEKQEHWMGIPYTIRPLSTAQIDRWSQVKPNPLICLLEPNPFIPQELPLMPIKTDSSSQTIIPHPELLVQNDKGKVYYSRDTSFQVPQTYWSFQIKTPAIERSRPSTLVLANLYIKCLEEALNPYTYNAKLADLEHSLKLFENGIYLTIEGYSPNAEVLFDMIRQRLKTCQPTESHFELIKESLMRKYQNFNLESALHQGLEKYQSILYENYSTKAEKAEILKTISYSQFLDYMDHLFDRTYISGLFYGDVERGQALHAWKKLEADLASDPYPLSEQPLTKVISLPSEEGPFFLESTSSQPSHAAILRIESPQSSFKAQAAQEILMQAMSGSFYSTLRTEQQTGYLVYAQAEDIENHLFNFFAVQSNTHHPRDLLARFELFIETFLQEMSQAELSEERFEVIRHSLLNTLATPPHSLFEMGALLEPLAFKYKGDFERTEKRIQGFKELTYEEFLDFASESLGKSNKRRLAILIEGNLNGNKELKYLPLKDIAEIRKMGSYTLKEN